MLSHFEEVTTIFQAMNEHEAIALASTNHSEATLRDIGMPEMNGWYASYSCHKNEVSRQNFQSSKD